MLIGSQILKSVFSFSTNSRKTVLHKAVSTKSNLFKYHVYCLYAFSVVHDVIHSDFSNVHNQQKLNGGDLCQIGSDSMHNAALHNRKIYPIKIIIHTQQKTYVVTLHINQQTFLMLMKTRFCTI